MVLFYSDIFQEKLKTEQTVKCCVLTLLYRKICTRLITKTKQQKTDEFLKKIPKKKVFVYVVKQMLLATPGVARAESEARTRALTSERRHAVEVEIGPLWTAGAFVLVCVGAVAVLVRALRRFVRIIVANLFVFLLLFDAGETKKRTHAWAR